MTNSHFTESNPKTDIKIKFTVEGAIRKLASFKRLIHSVIKWPGTVVPMSGVLAHKSVRNILELRKLWT